MKLVVWQEDSEISVSLWDDANFRDAGEAIQNVSSNYWEEECSIETLCGYYSYGSLKEFLETIIVTDVTPDEADRIAVFFGTTNLSSVGSSNVFEQIAKKALEYTSENSEEEEEDWYEDDEDDEEDEFEDDDYTI